MTSITSPNKDVATDGRDSLNAKELDFLIAIYKNLAKKDGLTVDYKEIIKETNGMTIKTAYDMAWKLKKKLLGKTDTSSTTAAAGVNGTPAGKKRGRPVGGQRAATKRRKVDIDSEDEVEANVKEEDGEATTTSDTEEGDELGA